MLNDALDVLPEGGRDAGPDRDPGRRSIADTIGFILSVEAAAAFDDLTRSEDISDPSLNTWPNTFRTHRFVPAVEYIRAQRARTLLIREMDTLMSQYDVFLSPTDSGSLGLDEPDRASGAGAARRASSTTTPVELMVTGTALRRGDGAAGRAGLRARAPSGTLRTPTM